LKQKTLTTGLLIGFFLWLSLHSFGVAGKQDIIAAAKDFFSELNRQNYDKAYTRLSHKLILSITPQTFKTSAQSIEGVSVLKFEIVESYQKLARLDLKARVFLWYEGKLYDAIYLGHATLVKENNSWKLDACDMKPIQQALTDGKKATKNIQFLSN